MYTLTPVEEKQEMKRRRDGTHVKRTGTVYTV